MTTSKFAFTDAQAMAIALAMTNGETPDAAIVSVLGESRNSSHTVENLARKFSHKMHIMKSTKAKTTKSKVHIANENTADKYVSTLNSGDVFNLSDLMNANPSITTYSKAAAIVNILVESGKIVRNGSQNGKTVYKVN
jgi:hypothetical protein